MNIKDKQPSGSLEFADVRCEGEVELYWDGTENYLNMDYSVAKEPWNFLRDNTV